MDDRHEAAARWIRAAAYDFRANVVRDAETKSCRYEEIVAENAKALFARIEAIASSSDLPVATLVGISMLDLRL